MPGACRGGWRDFPPLPHPPTHPGEGARVVVSYVDLGFYSRVKSQRLLKAKEKMNGINVHQMHNKISFALGIPHKLLKIY